MIEGYLNFEFSLILSHTLESIKPLQLYQGLWVHAVQKWEVFI